MSNYIWDVISVALIACVIFPFLRYVESHDPRWLWMGVGLLLADGSTKIIKNLTYPLQGPFLRPKDGSDCDIFCRNGPSGGRPGFPSGHMTVTTFFFTYLWLKNQSTQLAIFGLFTTLLMALARMKKQCHNELQVLFGAFWGAALAVFWFKLEKYFPWPNQGDDKP